MNTLELDYLPAPTVPVAEQDGLIKLSDLTQDVLMHFPVWKGSRPRDGYQLALNGIGIGEFIRFPDPVPEGLLTLKIPLELLNADGKHKVAYRTIGYPSGLSDDSLATTIRIDRTAPGAALLAPMIFPQINFGEVLAAQIPGYADINVGDTLQVFCNGIQGPAYTVSEHDLSENIIQISFSHDFLRCLDSGQIEFTYQVTDRAGNKSNLSWPLTLGMTGQAFSNTR